MFANSLQNSSVPDAFVDIKINIDGLPLFKSSPINLWPILMLVPGVSHPLPLAIFAGIGKPDLLPFLNRLCSEISRLKCTGFFFKCVKLRNIIFICDTPAKNFVLGSKGHTSYHGCSWCRQIGVYSDNRMVFSHQIDCPRSDSAYANFIESNQCVRSPILELIPMYSCFPPDLMHVVCLGVVRRLLHCYCVGVPGFRLPCKLGKPNLEQLNNKLLAFKSYIPSEFQRKTRSLSELEFFKASEFRTIVLYTGPLVFKDILNAAYYEHFLLLHLSIYIFSSESFSYLYHVATACINLFVSQMPTLFHTSLVSFHMHALLHIPEFVRLYGPLHNFSAFPFENYLYLLKRRIRANNGIFRQSVNQLLNVRTLYSSHATDNTLLFTASCPNNCALSENGDVILVDFVQDSLVSGVILCFERELFTHPYSSRIVGIGYYSRTRKYVKHVVPVSKAILVPFESEYFIIPFV